MRRTARAARFSRSSLQEFAEICRKCLHGIRESCKEGGALERDFTVATFRLPPFAASDAASLGQAFVQAAESVRQKVDLYLFPGLMALGLAPGLDLRSDAASQLADASLKDAYLAAGSYAARTIGAALVPGTVYLATPQGRVQQYAAVFDQQGNLVGEQLQTHRDELVTAVSDEVSPIAVDAGVKVGLLVGRDAWYPEVSRILSLQGADVLLAPLAPVMPYSAEEALCGLWQEVQQNQVFGVEAGLFGVLAERVYAGRAAILAPCEMTEDDAGFLPTPGYYVGTGGRSASLVVADLAAVRRDYPLMRHLNPGLYRKYLPSVYRRPR